MKTYRPSVPSFEEADNPNGQSAMPSDDESGLALRLTEANHRIANSLQLACTILSDDARRATSAETRAALSAVANRISAVAMLHRLLSLSGGTDVVELGAYVRRLCAEIGASPVGGRGATFSVDVHRDEPIYLEADAAVDLGIIVAELLTNSVKHGGASPVCSVAVARTPGFVEIAVADNGPGLPADSRFKAGAGVGLDLVRGMVARLKGELVMVPSAIGAHFRLTVPARVE